MALQEKRRDKPALFRSPILDFGTQLLTRQWPFAIIPGPVLIARSVEWVENRSRLLKPARGGEL